ncbi:hypothetical protein EDEG_01810 [Edhazardia aedis USNM 41457]|uniref:Uncharacterized protein n=1 Tax=Edhazardia aedis (strain USNM 41457) TaxID=1003232 RepID=J9DMV4_EDHAE|nr:hypothetical protein EDEG_01810 [Edhazardia aedis USNM 41457]|eukprot:EJW03900.1 hypothetical protein EDEG_01810 [Edhazardia aedis USNM 41457]
MSDDLNNQLTTSTNELIQNIPASVLLNYKNYTTFFDPKFSFSDYKTKLLNSVEFKDFENEQSKMFTEILEDQHSILLLNMLENLYIDGKSTKPKKRKRIRKGKKKSKKSKKKNSN